ncbi:hypothetical protein HanIR_Chr14g0708021 [Helianthus annuus]|nr:hypothetical protein HanIR_Chr14g0708021 [Helianthus annuus]
MVKIKVLFFDLAQLALSLTLDFSLITWSGCLADSWHTLFLKIYNRNFEFLSPNFSHFVVIT